MKGRLPHGLWGRQQGRKGDSVVLSEHHSSPRTLRKPNHGAHSPPTRKRRVSCWKPLQTTCTVQIHHTCNSEAGPAVRGADTGLGKVT